jgi:ADP-heptose:LPS heptosyltransferase
MARPAQLQADRGNPRLKFLDRYVGIPAVAALSARRRVRGARPFPTDWHSVGIFLTAGIGDTVVASGVIRDVRAARPDARIVVFATANNADFARLLEDTDAVVELPVRRIPTAVRMVRAEHCDVILDLNAWTRYAALLAELSGARFTVGRRTPGQFRHYGYDVVVDHQRDHELDNDRRLVAELGVRSTSFPRVDVPAGARSPLATPYVVFHLWPGGANFAERSWPAESWRALAQAMNARGFTVVLTGGPGDAVVNRELTERWVADGIRVQNAAGTDWPHSLVWLGFASGVVSVNTGVMHVAAALGTPTIALNGPTSGQRWGPLGPHTRCVASPMVPNGYLDLGFEQDARYSDCMRAITVDMVLDAWDDLRAEAVAAGRA